MLINWLSINNRCTQFRVPYVYVLYQTNTDTYKHVPTMKRKLTDRYTELTALLLRLTIAHGFVCHAFAIKETAFVWLVHSSDQIRNGNTRTSTFADRCVYLYDCCSIGFSLGLL